MKRFKLLILFLTVTAGSMAQPKHDQCSVTNKAFQAGEKLTYQIAFKWGPVWLSAGEASFTLESTTYNNKPGYHAIGYGETYKSYDWFFKVRDKYESYIDPVTLQPQKFIRNVYEGGYTIYNNVTFKHSEGKATSTNGTFDVPNCIQDVLSAVYYARCIDFSKYKVNDIIPVTIFLDDSIYPLYIRYIGKQELKTKTGTYRCIVFKPLLIQGTIFKGGEQMTVYVTDDENKIPVRVASPILIGEILAELIDTKGLRNNATAKLK